MKPVKNLVFAALLVSSLAFNTFAGEIDLPGAYTPPPPPRMTTVCDQDTSSTCTPTEEPVTVLETSDSLFYEALVALLSVY